MPAIRKLRNILLIFSAFLILFLLTGRYLIKLPDVQTWLVKHAARYLSKELGTNVTIGGVDIRLFRSILLEDLFIADLQSDTILYAPKFEARLSRFSIPKRRLTISQAVLTDARIGIKLYKEPRDYNIDFIINYFSGNNQDTSASKPWDIKLDKILLVNNTFTYRDLKYDDTTKIIDWEDIALNNLNAELQNLIPAGDTLSFRINSISFTEKSGFNLHRLSADALIAPGLMHYKNLDIITEESKVHGDVKFTFESMDDFSDFIEKVEFDAHFRPGIVHSNDLAYFATELIALDRSVELKGDVRGTVARFKAKNLEIAYSPTTYFKGNVNMTGLPDIEETYMEISVDELSVHKKDIETIPVAPFDSMQTIRLPDNLAKLGTLNFNGKFNGFYNDFVAYGNTSTALGYISSDLNLKVGDHDRNTTYSGGLTLFNFDIGKLWNLNPDVGEISMKAKVRGKGFELQNLKADLEGEVSRLVIYNYPYTNIHMNGHMGKKIFTGELTVQDPNLDFDFQGSIDVHPELPVFNFSSSIRSAKLAKLNLLKGRDESSELTAELNINMTGNTIDNAQGTILIEEVNYVENEHKIHSERIFLESVFTSQRSLTLESDLADAKLKGIFSLSTFIPEAKQLIAMYIPALVTDESKRSSTQVIDYNVQLKNITPVLNVFTPGITTTGVTSLTGYLNSQSGEMAVNFNSDEIGIGGTVFNHISLNSRTRESYLDINTSIDRFQLNDSIYADELSLNGSTRKDTASITLALLGRDTTRSKAVIRFDSGFLNTGYTKIKTTPEMLLFEGVNWHLDTSNFVLFDSTGILFDSFTLKGNDQQLAVNGIIGRDTSAKMAIQFTNFEAAQLNTILGMYEVQTGGRVNGKAEISSVLTKPVLNSELAVTDLRWFADTLGNAELITRWNSSENIIGVNGTVTKGGDKNIQVSGKYLIKEKNDELDFDIKIQKTYLNTFSQYVEGIFSNLNGIISADLTLKGTANKPALKGTATLQKVSMTIDYLKTTYNFNSIVTIDEKAFRFDRILLNDHRGNDAIVNGAIFHNNLQDFYFDLDIQANNVQVLNTTIADNDIFYGTAYASGKVSITGYLDYIIMNMGLKSEKGTKINIPLSNPDEVRQSSFITFMSADTTSRKEVADGPDFSGIELNMDFEVTPDASIFLIFDSKIGDVIEGSGSGNISMTVSPSEDFRMFGTYEIEQGKYLFTLQNVVNKPFFIEQGGYIRWNGNPYDAYIKLDARYKLKAGLYDLFQDSTFRKLVPVDLELHLTDKLFNPSISFDINVQNVDPTIDNQIRRMIDTEEEKYRQAVALLVMRRFTAPSEYRSTVSSGNVVGANAYEMLSNQLSNWASQISNQVNVGVNYRPGDALTSEELEVALSTSILNDRVTIDGNVGYANSSSPADQNTSNLVGDFNVEVKASKDGRIRLKAFNRSNNNSLINNINSPYTQGVGVFYREEFNSLRDLGRKYRELFRRKKNAPETSEELISQ